MPATTPVMKTMFRMIMMAGTGDLAFSVEGALRVLRRKFVSSVASGWACLTPNFRLRALAFPSRASRVSELCKSSV